jgi:RNA polymerase sigma-70 factor (ECF subfamily)
MNHQNFNKKRKRSINPEKWVDRYGNALYAYAVTRVRDKEAAAEIVQDTFFAAFKAKNRFKGRSSEKTWLTGILKHKIIDHFRKNAKERPLFISDNLGESAEEIFDRRGNWINRPQNWSNDPGRSLEQKDFLKVLYQALDKLPPRLAQVFVLREMDGLESEEICKILDITRSNLWVMLHRARTRLRHHMEAVWLKDSSQTDAIRPRISELSRPVSMASAA